MVNYRVLFSKQAAKDVDLLKQAGLSDKAKKLIAILEEDPFRNPPRYEKLCGDLSGAYSRRINIHHRLVYQVFDGEKIVRIIRMWKHYE